MEVITMMFKTIRSFSLMTLMVVGLSAQVRAEVPAVVADTKVLNAVTPVVEAVASPLDQMMTGLGLFARGLGSGMYATATYLLPYFSYAVKTSFDYAVDQLDAVHPGLKYGVAVALPAAAYIVYMHKQMAALQAQSSNGTVNRPESSSLGFTFSGLFGIR
jgi:hypothetical protein